MLLPLYFFTLSKRGNSRLPVDRKGKMCHNTERIGNSLKRRELVWQNL